MKKRVVLSAVTAVCGVSAYCAYKKKANYPFMSKKEIQAFITTFSQPYGKKGNIHPGNILLSKHCSLGTDPARTGINNNILVLGSPECKRRELMQANLLQRNGSYIVLDDSGEMLATTGAFFEQSGYELKVLDLTDEANSMRYNPLCYLEKESDVRMMARYILETRPFDHMGVKAAELALLEALVLYLWKFQPKSECTLSSIYKLIKKMKDAPSAMACMFDEVALHNPEELCLKRYRHFGELAKENLPGILADILKRVSYLDSEAMNILTSDDEMDLNQVAGKPTVFYVITGTDQEGLGWLCGMLVTQAIDILSKMKKSMGPCGLKYPVRFLLDGFCHTPIQGFPGRLSSNRRMLMQEASFVLFAESMTEVDCAYPEDLGELLFACDTVLCFHRALMISGREIARVWGGKCVKAHSRKAPSYRIASRFDENDLRKIDPEQVAIIVRGMKPIRDAMFQIEDHLDAGRLTAGHAFTCTRPAIPSPAALELYKPKGREAGGS